MKKIIAFLIVAGFSFFFLSGCGTKDKVQLGDTISIIYTATFSDGTIFDENNEKTPLMFTAGSGQVIKGIDKAVIGMKVGKKKTITIEPEQGYGSLYNETSIQKVGKLIFDKIGITPEMGKIQKLDQIEGIIRNIETDEYGNEVVLFDINPRQTRDTLTYKITLIAKQD